MTLHAFDDIEDALDATRTFLFPVDLGRWLRLAVVAFFVGGTGGSVPGGQLGGGGDVPVPSGGLPSVGVPELAAVVAVAVTLLALALAFGLVGAVMEFVLVESLRREEVRLRRYVRRYLGAGLRLLAFRVGLGLVALALVVGPLAAFVLAGGGFDPSVRAVVGLVLLALPLVVAVGVTFALVQGFTTAFVVPAMLLEGRGVLSGWRRFWPVLRGAWTEFLAYAVVVFLLTLAAGALVGLVVGIAALVVGIPLAVVGVVGFLVGGSGASTLAVVAVLAVVFLLVLVTVGALIQVPVVAFFRYYSLLVLGDVDSDLDAIPERRRALRDDADDSGSAPGPESA